MSRVSPKTIWIDYTNWRGERQWRAVKPLHIAFESSEWHPEFQWVMHAICRKGDLKEVRGFPLLNIHAIAREKPDAG